MNDQLNREETIFEAAMGLAPEQRAAYLKEACGGDPALHRRIEILLQAGRKADSFFDRGPLHAALGDELTATAVVPVTDGPRAPSAERWSTS